MPDLASPFHEGEIAIQQRLGVADQIGPFAARVVRDHMPDQHRRFYASLPFILLGAQDDEGWPIAIALSGPPGFASSPDATTLVIDIHSGNRNPLLSNLQEGGDIGLLGLQPETRRRNRMSGRIRSFQGDRLVIDVKQAFGNCPQYIHTRELSFDGSPRPAQHPATRHLDHLSTQDIERIKFADTMFIASAYTSPQDARSYGADVSHRGGRPGFVRIEDPRTLIIPDYSGNNHFNTIGNLNVNPRAGLLFLNFKTGDALHVTCETSMIWDGPLLETLPEAQRAIRCAVVSALYVPAAVSIHSEFIAYSPSFRQT